MDSKELRNLHEAYLDVYENDLMTETMDELIKQMLLPTTASC
jgi:hypothetical protein